jgi:amiloride-sensitive sodium channel
MVKLIAESSFHGVAFIFGPNRNIFVRIFWSTILFASTCGLFYYIHGAYIKWLVEPDIIAKSYVRNVTEFPLPAFTVCPRIFGRNEEIKAHQFFDGSLDLSSIDKHTCKIIKTHIHWCDVYSVEEPDFSLNPKCNFTSDSLLEDLNSTFPDIKFLVDMVDVTDKISRTITSHGLCLTYNMYSKNIFNNDISDDLRGFINTNDPDDEWSADNQFSTSNSSYPPHLKERARTQITIEIPRQDVENYCTESWNKTFMFFIHPPNQFPTRFTKKLEINYGTMNSFYIEMKSFRSSKSLKIIDPDIRKCFFEDEGNLKYFKTYSPAHCELECFKNEIMQTSYINCSIMDLPREKKLQKQLCLQKQIYFFMSQNWSNLKRKCKCYENCNYVQYLLKDGFLPGFSLKTQK